jgi:heptosyltransferase-2
MPSPETAQPLHRILVRGVNWLGDAVMTLPALQRLRQAHPRAHIAVLTPDKLAGLWSLVPAVDRVIPFARNAGVWSVANTLRRENFDSALVLPNSPRSAIETWLARIPNRTGLAAPWRNGFLTRIVPPRPGRVPMHKRSVGEIRRLVSRGVPDYDLTAPENQAHQVFEYLHLAAALGGDPSPVAPQLKISSEQQASVAAKFDLSFFNPNGASGKGRPVLGLNAGAEYGPAKRWPMENFITAAVEIRRRTGCGIVLFGGPGDVVLAGGMEPVLRQTGTDVRNLAGRTTLHELCVALSLCSAVLTNDTGPMHLAAAAGSRVVVPFGSTSPELTGPGLPGDTRHRLLKSEAVCSPCFRRECPVDFRCMRDIAVGRVVEAVLAVL